MKRNENTRMTAETVERTSCPQNPQRPRVASPATQLAPRCVRRVSEEEARWDATAGIIMVPRGDDDARTRCAARGARSETAAVTVLNAIVSVAM